MVPHPPLIIPEVGRGEERKIQNTIDAYGRASKMVADMCPDTVVVISPHTTAYFDYFHISPGKSASGSFASFGAPNVSVSVEYDSEFADAISEQALLRGVDAGTLGERVKELDHATLIPLYFLREACGGKLPFKVVRVGLSGMPLAEHYKLGMAIKDASERANRRIAVVASGDLSHVLKAGGPYGYKEEGPIYDDRIMDVMSGAEFGKLFDFGEAFCERAAECGHRSFVIMAGCFDGTVVKAEKLSYEGPFGVGYGVCVFTPDGTGEGRHFLEQYFRGEEAKTEAVKDFEDEYVRLARKSLEAFILRRETIKIPDGLSDELTKRRAGVFVSLKKHGRLRGCIGTIAPTRSSIAEEIIRNAISSSTEDPRFDAVRPDELKELVYSVDVLGEPESIDSLVLLDVVKYGVIVTNGGRRGLLLPNLDGVDTVGEQISIAKQKAGISENEPVKLQRFEVVRHY